MQTTPTVPSSFGIGNILGLVFVLFGVFLILASFNKSLPFNLGDLRPILEYGAAIGSIFGGLSMLFKKKETVSNIKIK
jgi:hypothetical protein